MKGNKKVLALSILVLLLAVTFGTYAIYRSSAEGEGTVNAANWSVQIAGSDISSADFDFDASDVTWTTLTGYNDTIAPGSEGYIDIAVDADGSEVDVILAATLDTTNLPTGMTATVQGGNSQTINYSATEGAMETTVRINIAWAGAESDNEIKDGTDLAVKGTSLSLPVTLTAKQSLEDHS